MAKEKRAETGAAEKKRDSGSVNPLFANPQSARFMGGVKDKALGLVKEEPKAEEKPKA